ncbi:MAG: TonB-dependent receptor [Pyrinomonadaceae bacterium]
MKAIKNLLCFFLIIFAIGWSVAPAFGQSDRGTIQGSVTDPNDALVPNAKVTVTNIETGETRQVTTSDVGTYTVPQLKAAVYSITVEAEGFKTSTLENVQVGVGINRTANVKLELGVAGETVVVSSDPSVINTESAVLQRNVTEKEVRELPLLVGAESAGRSPLSFIFLDSSVTATGGGGSQGINGTNFRINGSQGLGQEILIDGAGTRRGENGTFFSEVAPGPNAFQEFTLNTSNYSAEFGNSTGGVISFTIKSGGNDFHGEGYYYLINEALNANTTLNRLNDVERQVDRQRNYGFSFSGPVVLPRFGSGTPMFYNGKNKTFFFFNYEAYRTQQSETVITTVPTARMRNGDFSELLTDPYILQFFGGPLPIFDPSLPPGARMQFPGNIIPQSSISPVGRNFINLFPLPNTTGPLGSTVFRNYLASSTAGSRTMAYTTKINQILSDKQQLNLSYIYRKLPSTKGGFPRFPGDFVNQGVWDQTFRSYYVRVQHDYSITPNLLNHVNVGWNRTSVQNFNFGRGAGRATDLGLPVGSTQDLGLPLIGFPGYGDPVNSADPRAIQAGGSTFFDNDTNDNTAEFSDSITVTRGRHTLRIGGDVRRQQLNVAGFNDIGGNFNFRSNQTANVNDGNEGYPLASLITGRPEFSFNSLQSIQPAYEYLFASGFAQDDIKLTPKLTLNVGIRYDYDPPRNERFDRFRGFSPTAVNPEAGRLGALVGAAGQGGLSSEYRGLVKPDKSAWGPRFGFAYSINEKTVVRGGWGLYYSPLFYGNGGDGLLGYNPGAVNINGGLDAGITLDNYPPLPIADPNSQYISDLSITQDYYDQNFKLGRVAQYNLSLQRQLPWNFAISVSYIGNKGTRLRSSFNPLNSLPIEALKLGDALLRKKLADVTDSDRAYAASVGFPLPASPAAVYPGFDTQFGNGTLERSVAQALRPFPQYGLINNRLESQGQSNYNALKLDLQRRFTDGIQFGVSYTYSKLITDAASDLYGGSALTGVLQNPGDRESLRSLSPDDVPHSVVFSYIIELPFGKGKRFLNKGAWIDRLVGGWQINGIQRYRSGTPITVFIAGGRRDFLDLLGYGGNLRPNLTGQDFYVTDSTIAGNPQAFRYINPGAFVAPPVYAGTSAAIGSPEYAAYYSDPYRFLGTAAPTLNGLRSKTFLTEDLSVLKKTRITETIFLEFRVEFFNLFNRNRPAFPESNFDSGNFGNSGYLSDPYQPRRIQLGARLTF